MQVNTVQLVLLITYLVNTLGFKINPTFLEKANSIINPNRN